MEIISEIVNSFWFQTLFKLLLGCFLTGLIGLERSSLNKPAGFGTHALIGLSAVLIVICSEYLSLQYDIDISRIPSQLLPGIGFIGAGTILRNGFNVKGVTTAAGILSVTCIGLTIGAGYYFAGIISTIIVYFVLSYSHEISEKFERYNVIDLEIKITDESKKTISEIEKYLTKKDIEIKEIKVSDKKGATTSENIIKLTIQYDNRTISKNTIIKDVIALDYVSKVTEHERI